MGLKFVIVKPVIIMVQVQEDGGVTSPKFWPAPWNKDTRIPMVGMALPAGLVQKLQGCAAPGGEGRQEGPEHCTCYGRIQETHVMWNSTLLEGKENDFGPSALVS